MIRRPPRSTRTDTLFPYTTLFRSQIEILSRATPKRDYYCQSRRGNRLFELGLGEVAMAFVAASAKSDQIRIAELLGAHGRDGFAAAWLHARGAAWAAEPLPSAPRESPP